MNIFDVMTPVQNLLQPSFDHLTAYIAGPIPPAILSNNQLADYMGDVTYRALMVGMLIDFCSLFVFAVIAYFALQCFAAWLDAFKALPGTKEVSLIVARPDEIEMIRSYLSLPAKERSMRLSVATLYRQGKLIPENSLTL